MTGCAIGVDFSTESARAVPGADLRTDIPRCRVYRRGRLEAEETEITRY